MKKILFNDRYGLNQAVLDGRKTNTRRIVPERLFQECRSNGWIEAGGFNAQWKEKALALLLKSSPYKVGEEVAIAQSYFDCGYSTKGCRYEIRPVERAQFGDGSAGWSNKMFVRADLMPHRIRITNVRVERLQDISDEDCLKEGISTFKNTKGVDVYCFHCSSCFISARQAFAALIDKTCGRGTGDSNPYVFVYDFELVK